jgi:hypothetical protein
VGIGLFGFGVSIQESASFGVIVPTIAHIKQAGSGTDHTAKITKDEIARSID